MGKVLFPEENFQNAELTDHLFFSSLFNFFFCRYGCEHEATARAAFIHKRVTNRHTNFVCRESGLHLSKEYPFIAATPDGIISCDCCGEGLLEIKCPYTYCDKELPNKENYNKEEMKRFCLEPDEEGILGLKLTHPYYYQVQAQLNICQKEYCDFVIWNKQDLIVQRFNKDEKFFKDKAEQVQHFVTYGVLPELVGKWITRQVIANEDGVVLKEVDTNIQTTEEDTEDDESGRLVCYCNMVADESMLLCCNKNCAIKQFHMECLRVRCPPKGKWYCPYCRTLPKFNRSKKTKS